MKLLIAGSRTITDYQLLAFYVQGVENVTGIDIDVIISGGARGIDTLAKEFALSNEIPFIEMKADWSQGKGAGFKRNTDMVEQCDGCIILWDGMSNGTVDTAKKILNARKPLWMFTIDMSENTEQLELEV